MEHYKLAFMFEDMPVGVFQEPEFPSRDGSYHYMPFRGPGHYLMGKRLHEAGSAQCSYIADGMRVLFSVRSCPKYGVLDLEKFERSPHVDA